MLLITDILGLRFQEGYAAFFIPANPQLSAIPHPVLHGDVPEKMKRTGRLHSFHLFRNVPASPRAGLLWQATDGPQWATFDPSARASAHPHHARKYVGIRLPDARAFWFGSSDGQPGAVAHNMNEFYTAVQAAPVAVMRRHLMAGDFSRWTADTLGDEQVAAGLRKIERTVQQGAGGATRRDSRAHRGPLQPRKLMGMRSAEAHRAGCPFHRPRPAPSQLRERFLFCFTCAAGCTPSILENSECDRPAPKLRCH